MMENNILLLLPISTNVSESKSKLNQDKRKEQYINGIKRILEYEHIKNFDIVLVDNTTTSIDKDIQQVMPFISETITIDKNENGQRNPGAGILDVWHHLKNDISTYDWIIHFEPRQMMKDFRIFETFMENPRNIFMYGDNKKNHYYTGLFTIKSSTLLYYLSKMDGKNLARKHICLEYNMFEILNDVNVTIDIVDKMGVLWHDRAKNRHVDL